MDFQIFIDKDLQIPTSDPIYLGKLKAGQSKKFTFYLYNSSVNPYEEMKFTFDSSEVIMVSAPTEMEEKSKAEIVLEWNPKIDIRQGLKIHLKIEGYEVIG